MLNGRSVGLTGAAMPRSLLLLAALALPGLIAGPALAQAEAEATAAEAVADGAQAEADAAQGTAAETQSEADAQAATEAQAEADAALDTADTADTTAGDAADVAAAFRGGIRSIRILKNLSQEYRVTGTADGSELAGVTALKVRFDGPFDDTFVGPLPSVDEVTLPRTGASYDAMGFIPVSEDGAGAPVWDATYNLTVSLIDPGADSSPLFLSGARVGHRYSASTSPHTLEGSDYALASIDWSESADCFGCPVISLVDLREPASPEFGLAPLSVQVTAEPVSADATFWMADFAAFDQGFDFEGAPFDFDADALDAEYALTATLISEDGPVGEPTRFSVLVEEDDTVAPEPDPTPALTITSNLSGSVTVGDGEYVVLQAQVGRSITVRKGGTLLIQGGVIGRDLKLNGGEVILADATIGRNLKVRGGVIEVGEAVIGRDLQIKGGVEVLGDAESLLVVGRNLTGRTADAVVLGGTIDVLNRVGLRAGDLVVNGTFQADDDIDMRVRGSEEGGLHVNGSVTSELGDVDLRSRTSGGLIVSGDVQAEGDIDMRARNGDLTVNGTVTAATDLDLRVRRGDGDLTINGSISASSGEIELRVNNGNGGLVVTGSIQAEGDIDMRVGTGGETGAVLDGTIASHGDIEARGRTDFWINGSVAALGDIDLRDRDGGTVVGLWGEITALGLIDLDSDTTTEVNGNVTSLGLIDLNSGSDTTVNGNVQAQGLVDLNSGGNITVNGNVSSSALSADDLGDEGGFMGALSGGIGSFFGLIDLNSGGSTSINGNVSATALNLGGLGGQVGGMFGNEELGSTLGHVTISSGTSTSIDGTVVAEGLIDLTSGTDTTVTGSVTAQELISVESGGTILVQGPDGPAALVTVLGGTADGGDIVPASEHGTSIEANINAAGSISFLGAGVSLYSNTTDNPDSGGNWMVAGGDIVIDASTTLEVNGSVTAQGDVSFGAGDSTEVNGTVDAVGHVGLLGTPTIVMESSGDFDFRISGGDGVDIFATESVSMERGSIESPDGSVTIQARGIVGRWNFDDAAAQDSSGHMTIQAGGNVTLDAIERLDLVGATVVADQGSVTLRGDGCTASYGIDDAYPEPVLMVVSAGTDVTIEATAELELAGTQIEAIGGDITILASAFRRGHELPLDIPDAEFDANGSITVGGSDFMEVFGTYTWSEGEYTLEVDPAVVFTPGPRPTSASAAATCSSTTARSSRPSPAAELRARARPSARASTTRQPPLAPWRRPRSRRRAPSAPGRSPSSRSARPRPPPPRGPS